MKFYRCEHCGNIVAFFHSSGVPVVCCGEPMKELAAGVVEASAEKHIPAVEVQGNKVSVVVGSVEHPMLPEHYIQMIVLETASGHQYKKLSPEQAPKAEFVLAEGDSAVAVYEYCNLHGLWKAEL